jgi:hypothetical protein
VGSDREVGSDPGGDGDRDGGSDRDRGSDRVTGAAESLYAAGPADFTQRRKALADAARADGDKGAANRITALRKPTRVAWILNGLARADPDAPGRLATLAADLRAAAESKDGPRLRELSADRGELIDGLTSQALAAANVTDPPAGLREDIAATLTSALADPDTARQFAAGTLTRAAQWAGFGLVPAAGAPDDAPDDDAPDVGAPDVGAPGDGAEPAPARAPGPALPDVSPDNGRANRAPSAARDRPKTAARGAGRPVPVREPPPPSPSPSPSRAPRATRRAEAPEDVAARRRQAVHDAERSLVSATQAATAAVAVEDRLEVTVRDLEERLTKARAELADARLRARRAEATERKARQSLDRLPRPLRHQRGDPKALLGA